MEKIFVILVVIAVIAFIWVIVSPKECEYYLSGLKNEDGKLQTYWKKIDGSFFCSGTKDIIFKINELEEMCEAIK